VWIATCNEASLVEPALRSRFALVNAGQEPPLFDGEVAVLMHGWFSRIAPAGLSWF
jgi:hypothetical protein